MADLQQRTPAWHIARRGKLTASNLGAALGQVSYTSRQVAYQRALGLDKFQGNEACQWGNDNEMNGIAAYQAFTGNLVNPTGLHIHPHYKWLAGSPDGFVGEEGMIEVKCPFYFKRDGSGRIHKQVPPHYYQQMNALMEICDRQWCDYVCWSPEGMAIYRVMRDPQSFEILLHYYAQFYAAMQAQAEKPPPLTKDDKLKIESTLSEAIERSVFYKFWNELSYKTDIMPSSDPFVEESDDEDETLTNRAKRQCLSDISNRDNTDGDEGPPLGGEVAGEIPVL